jgi:hypothetical protein
VLPRSRDAELVAFWVEHHDMTKVFTVGLLADSRSPGGDQLGRFRTDELLAFGHVPWRLACHSDVDVHPVLGWALVRANVSVLGLSYGAFALGFGISFWQALIAGVIGIVISFLLCGLIALAGKARFRPYPGARQPAVPALTRRRTRTVRSTGPYG